MTQVTEINGIVADIAAGAKEQATGLHEVNSAVDKMDQATQQNAAMVEQSTAAAIRCRARAQQLAGLIDEFQVGRRPGGADAPRSSRRAACIRAPGKQPPPNMPRARPSHPGRRARGCARRRRQHESSEEFDAAWSPHEPCHASLQLAASPRFMCSPRAAPNPGLSPPAARRSSSLSCSSRSATFVVLRLVRTFACQQLSA